MAERLKNGRGETAAHSRLKRLAVFWAQTSGYSACAIEVRLPRCCYRVDVAAYRAGPKREATAVFECKQAWSDLRRDNCCVPSTRQRLEGVQRRRQVLEKHLRVHYPNLRVTDTLFHDFDTHDFAAIEHRGYTRVLREISALQNRLHACSKFETLTRYRCANLHYLVLPNELFRESEVPLGWGVLIETNGELVIARKPLWHELASESRLAFLERIAGAATRALNRELGITYHEVNAARCRSCPP
jgi:hypothetical protein